MPKIALFPGQGSQKIGMGSKAAFDCRAKRVFDLAKEISGYDILKTCVNGPEEILNDTAIALVCIFVTSLADFSQRDVDYDAVAGLSLGEYAALAACGSLNLEDALKLVKIGGELLANETKKSDCSMCALIGLNEDVVETICKIVSANFHVSIANYNCPNQVVISGYKNAVEVAVNRALEMGARKAIYLKVSGAFHSPLMQKAADKFSLFVDETKIHPPKKKFVSSISGRFEEDPFIIRTLLKKQMTSPVLWQQSVRSIVDNFEITSLDNFDEMEPSGVLTGLVIKII